MSLTPVPGHIACPATADGRHRVANLIYSVLTSLDGFIEDDHGTFEWAAPDEDVHAFVNDHERSIGTYLYGRGMYETMVAWETMSTGSDQPAVVRDFAGIWRAAEKIVFSTTLDSVASERTRIERSGDTETIRALKEASTHDLSVGGPGLAAGAIRAGLVDEVHLFVNPIIVGGGKPALPSDARVALELLDERRFAGGVVHLHYARA
jgi:dihydrofolate reductase